MKQSDPSTREGNYKDEDDNEDEDHHEDQDQHLIIKLIEMQMNIIMRHMAKEIASAKQINQQDLQRYHERLKAQES